MNALSIINISIFHSYDLCITPRVSEYDSCEAQGKGRAKGRLRKVTQRSFIDYRWWMVDGGYPFPDALH